MAVQFNTKNYLTSTLIALASLAILTTSALAQNSLFETAATLRSANNSAPQGVSSRQSVVLSDEVDPTFFNVTLDNQNLLGLSTHVRSSRTFLRSHSGRSTETTRGILLDENGSPVGNYVSSEISQGNESAHHILFRLAASGEHFVLSEGENGTYNLDQHNHDEMADCGHESHEEGAHFDVESLRKLNSRATDTTESSTIDILVLYSPEALEYSGSELSIEATISQAIELSNESYDNSNVPLQLNLVHSAQTEDNESGSFSTDLTRLQRAEDGYFDEAQSLREEHYADMVVLITAPGEYCGIGFTPSTVSGIQGGEYAYSVVAANCVDYYSFQHEVGHNLGLQHDESNAPSSTAFEGSYGYRWTGENNRTYRSVMAYSPGTRVPYFSNPEVSFEGGTTGANGAANNAGVLSAVASIAADYRVNPNQISEEPTEEIESGEESSGEGETILTAESLSISQLNTKKATTFSLTALDANGTGVSATEIHVYVKKKRKTILQSVITTDSAGVATYTAKKKKKGYKLLFEISGVTTMTKRVGKSRKKR